MVKVKKVVKTQTEKNKIIRAEQTPSDLQCTSYIKSPRVAQIKANTTLLFCTTPHPCSQRPKGCQTSNTMLTPPEHASPPCSSLSPLIIFAVHAAHRLQQTGENRRALQSELPEIIFFCNSIFFAFYAQPSIIILRRLPPDILLPTLK